MKAVKTPSPFRQTGKNDTGAPDAPVDEKDKTSRSQPKKDQSPKESPPQSQGQPQAQPKGESAPQPPQLNQQNPVEGKNHSRKFFSFSS